MLFIHLWEAKSDETTQSEFHRHKSYLFRVPYLQWIFKSCNPHECRYIRIQETVQIVSCFQLLYWEVKCCFKDV